MGISEPEEGDKGFYIFLIQKSITHRTFQSGFS